MVCIREISGLNSKVWFSRLYTRSSLGDCKVVYFCFGNGNESWAVGLCDVSNHYGLVGVCRI